MLIDPVDAARRVQSRPDRIEAEGLELQRAVDRAYRELAAMFPNRITTLDGMQPAEELARIVRDELRQLS